MEGEAGERLFVTKIPPHITREDVSAYFGQFGSTTDVYLPFVPGRAGHKGIAFISYADPQAAQMAISHGRHEINGQEVVVDVAAPKGGGKGGKGGKGGGKGGFAGGRPTAAQAFGNAPIVGPSSAPALQQSKWDQGPPQQFAAQSQGYSSQASAEASGDRLFVTKVPPSLTRDHLQEYFSAFGELTDVYMPMVPGQGTHKGIAFISFADSSSLQMALSFSPHEIEGCPIVVDVATPRNAQTSRTPGHFAAPEFPPAAPAMAVQQPMNMNMSMHPYAAPRMGNGMAAQQPPGAPAGGGFARNNTGTPVLGRLFLTRVALDVSKVDLQTYFQQFGQLEDLFVPSGGKGIAFVSYKDSAVAQQVLQQREHVIKPGSTVMVDQAMDRPPLGGGGGKGFSRGPWGFSGGGGGQRYTPY